MHTKKKSNKKKHVPATLCWQVLCTQYINEIVTLNNFFSFTFNNSNLVYIPVRAPKIKEKKKQFHMQHPPVNSSTTWRRWGEKDVHEHSS